MVFVDILIGRDGFVNKLTKANRPLTPGEKPTSEILLAAKHVVLDLTTPSLMKLQTVLDAPSVAPWCGATIWAWPTPEETFKEAEIRRVLPTYTWHKLRVSLQAITPELG